MLAIVLHAVAFLALGHVKIMLPFVEAEEIRTKPIQFEQVEVLPPEMDEISPTPETRDPVEATTLLEEVDILAQLPEDHELDITPEALDPEFAIKPQQPLPEGAPEALDMEAMADFDLAAEMPELGTTADPLPQAEEGQVVVDPGAALEDPELDRFTEQILKQGVEGGAPEGSLDGVMTLDDLVGLPESVLVGKKTMLPSDLLFEYNSAELRESARVGLMKLALLVERNPGLYCWIEGHTDLFGTDAYNLDLSRRRAAAVKAYLVDSLRLPQDKIVTRGFGKTQPLVREGDIDTQSPNRRVEIRMRRTLPPKDEIIPTPAPEPRPRPPEEQAPPRALLVRPARELPNAVEEEMPPRAPVVEEPAAPRAPVVEEPAPRAEPVAPRAVPVEESPPKAVPVEEEAPRAVPVGE
jgi:outer membrane protein OmpA-like peptidoglycan-associated protein